MIDQYLREMNENLAEVKSTTASLMAEEKRCQRDVDAITADKSKWEDVAKKALAAGNEEDAKKALANKLEIEGRLAVAEKTLATAKAIPTRCSRCTTSW